MPVGVEVVAGNSDVGLRLAIRRIERSSAEYRNHQWTAEQVHTLLESLNLEREVSLSDLIDGGFSGTVTMG